MQTMRSPAADSTKVAIPHSAFTVDGFEQWMRSDQFPTEGRIDLCGGEVLVDMSPERVDTHVELKGEIYWVIRKLVRADPQGKIFGDGASYTHEASGLVTQPDALYFTFDSFRQGRVQGEPEQGSPLGFRGTLDWVLEVVSPSSRTKDRKKLRDGYARAGIREYWIADATGQNLSLDILCLCSDRYVPAHSEDGWQKSEVFGQSFRIESRDCPVGMPEYDLRVRRSP